MEDDFVGDLVKKTTNTGFKRKVQGSGIVVSTLHCHHSAIHRVFDTDSAG